MSIKSGFSGRNVSFYGLPKSQVISGAPSLEEAIKLGGLDWTVGLVPAYQTKRDGTVVQVPDAFYTVREDTEQVLGRVGKQYAPFQAHDAFSFTDELLGYGIEFDAAASYDGDKKFFITAKLPEGIKIEGEEDLDLNLLFRSTHDGSGSISVMVTPIRLACTNQLNLATRQMVSKWSARHTSSAGDKVAEAAKTLRIVDSYKSAFEDTAKLLQATEMDLAQFTGLVKELVPASKDKKEPRAWAGLIETFQTSPTVDRTNGWGALNAVGEYFEHLRGGRGNVESRFESNLDGQTAAARNRALQLLVR